MIGEEEGREVDPAPDPVASAALRQSHCEEEPAEPGDGGNAYVVTPAGLEHASPPGNAVPGVCSGRAWRFPMGA